jgi:tetratricopeptide (TPR) repeat protein
LPRRAVSLVVLLTLTSVESADYSRRKDYRRALADFTQTILLEPQFDLAYTSRAGVYRELKDYRRAVADLREAARLDVQGLSGTHLTLAWFLTLTTCPDAQIRDGREAVAIARKVCKEEGWKDSLSLAALAAAYAEAGDFEKAILWQKKAVERADNSYRDRMRKPLRLYERGEPYREE